MQLVRRVYENFSAFLPHFWALPARGPHHRMLYAVGEYQYNIAFMGRAAPVVQACSSLVEITGASRATPIASTLAGI